MSRQKGNCPPPSAALTAGAFQDHLLHDLSIGELSLSNPLKSYAGLKQRLRSDEKKRKKALQNVRPTVDTGRIKKPPTHKRIEDDPEREYVLDPVPKPSLAQKLGLISLPDQPLTTEDWSSIKQRSIARDDFKNPCAICQEYFAISDQVLLSCSHVFHKACIQAFERFTGKKTCPMCRKIQYQARVVHDGTRVFKEKAAIRIQSFWRGYVVRKWYWELRRTVAPRDRRLRRKFYEDKLQEITDRMVAMTSSETVDRFLQDIDSSIASSRAIFQHFEDSCLHRLSDEDWVDIEVKAMERNDHDCPICLRSLKHQKFDEKSPDDDAKQALPPNLHKKPSRASSSKSTNSRTKTTQRNTKTSTKQKPSKSPISPQKIIGKAQINTPENTKSPKNSNIEASIALLSCSHVFHAKCLEALEDFCMMENLKTGLNFKCPVCRSLYVKRILS